MRIRIILLYENNKGKLMTIPGYLYNSPTIVFKKKGRCLSTLKKEIARTINGQLSKLWFKMVKMVKNFIIY